MFINLLFFLGLVLIFISGYLLGLLQKGIHIHHVDKTNDVPEEYNESLANHLDPEVRRYLDENNGQYKF